MSRRTFAAIIPPLTVVEELEDYVGPRRDADRRLSWIWPEHWHITTLFISDLPERSLDPLLEGLAHLAQRTPAFAIHLGGAGCFPNPFEARVFHLGVSVGERTLAALSKTGRAMASTAGAAPDGRRFVPHLTLARTRTAFDGTRWLGILDSFGGFDWTARELTVIRSHLGQGPGNRPRYEVLETLPLGRSRHIDSVPEPPRLGGGTSRGPRPSQALLRGWGSGNRRSG